MPPEVQAFFDEDTNTVSYVVKEPHAVNCAIIDPVLDFDFSSGGTDTRSADVICEYIERNELKLQWILETHVHADHLSAAPYIQERLGGKLGICSQITTVQETFGKVFNEGSEFQRDGSQFDRLFNDADHFLIGKMRCDVLHTPGHTPACATYVIGDAAFVGDTLFMPDFGTARADFPGGSAEMLYDSIQKLLTLPDKTRIFVGHDYKAPGREEFAWESSVAEQKAENIHIGQGAKKEDFVRLRNARDATLSVPRLIIPSLQINMRAGNLPAPDETGKSFLKLPINGL